MELKVSHFETGSSCCSNFISSLYSICVKHFPTGLWVSINIRLSKVQNDLLFNSALSNMVATIYMLLLST